ncbi:MAG: ribbon-helix-helix protein, CopG family [Candidatus Binatia bacterium]|nr:ribbon-helix-helix protein, CopG family [Candidatus Binatia bacterium]
MKTEKQTEQQTVTIRAPRELVERLEQLAREGDRSLNAQMVRALREWAEAKIGNQPFKG